MYSTCTHYFINIALYLNMYFYSPIRSSVTLFFNIPFLVSIYYRACRRHITIGSAQTFTKMGLQAAPTFFPTSIWYLHSLSFPLTYMGCCSYCQLFFFPLDLAPCFVPYSCITTSPSF